jgi:hypothetical protein
MWLGILEAAAVIGLVIFGFIKFMKWAINEGSKSE